MPGRIIRNQRYSFVFLTALSVLLAFGAVMISLKAVNDSQHKWCQIVNTIVSVPVPEPSGQKTDPRTQRGYKFYTEFVQLQRDLGC